MATLRLWERIAPHEQHMMMEYYNEKGLGDIRVHFSQWIEDTILSDRLSASNSEEYEQIAQQFFEDLKQKLVTWGSSQSYLKFNITEICEHISQTSAVDLYTHLFNGLKREFDIIKDMPQNTYITCGSVPMDTAASSPIMSGYNEVLQLAILRIQKNHNDLELLAIGGFESEYQQVCAFISSNSLSPRDTEELHQRYSHQLNIRKTNIEGSLILIFREHEDIQSKVIDELLNWKRSQALAGNGAPFAGDLSMIQRCIELLLEMVIAIRSSVDKMIRLVVNSSLGELQQKVRRAQEVLVTSSFIVEKQPPQVMKTNTRFAAAVRWLIGPGMGISQSAPEVECIILSEAQAKNFSQTPQIVRESRQLSRESSGEIQNNRGNMDFNPQTHVFGSSFRNMQLKKIKRAEKKGTESVMDEKFALLFYTSCFVENFEIQVWTLSLPVVVIVHGNQEPQSWATITWDNAFSDRKREPFVVPDKVTWSHLSSALNTKFSSSTQRPLTEDNLNFIHEKLFRHDIMGDHKDYITWAQFCKEPLPDRTFTFWDWFFAIMKLTKDHLLNLWKDGLVVGFINKSKAEELLSSMQPGTFLLRFSDSELGGITIGLRDQNNVVMLQPWTARDLQIRGLADRVHDIHNLKYLFNNIEANKPKDLAFGQFYTQRLDEQTTRDGYVPNSIRAHVPAIEQRQTQPQQLLPSAVDIPMVQNNETEEISRILETLQKCHEILPPPQPGLQSNIGMDEDYQQYFQ